MLLSTTSEVISFIRKMEEQGAEYYENAAAIVADKSQLFRGFAEENRKFVKQVERTYYGVISDALEGGFAFSISRNEYDIELSRGSQNDLMAVMETALEIEVKILRLYEEAARQSQQLMADIPRVLTLVARKRKPRIEVLKGLIRS